MRRILNSRLPYFCGLAVIFLSVAWLSVFLWPTLLPNYDMEWDTRNALELLRHGVIPMHGGVASFFVFNPPGVTLGMLPGVWLFPTEPVLAEKVGCLLLLALTQAGLFFLVAKRFGYPAALLAVALYTLSANGLYFADTMRPRAHPVFLVWMLFFLERWVNDKSRDSLSTAVFIYIAGAFWMMEIVPAALIFVIAWFAYRPKIHWAGLIFAVTAGILLWSPYLVFESQRKFTDVRCLIARQSMIKTNWDVAMLDYFTDRNLKVVEGERPHDLPGGERAENLDHPPDPQYEWVTDPRVGWCYRALLESKVDGVPGYWLCPSSSGEWWFLSSDGERFLNAKSGWSETGPGGLLPLKSQGLIHHWSLVLTTLAKKKYGPLLLGPFPECAWIPGRVVLCLTGCGCACWLFVSVALSRIGIASKLFSWAATDPKERASLVLFCVAAIAPWLLTALLVEPGEPDVTRRFIWLWVAFALFIVVCLRQLLRNVHPGLAYAVIVALVVMTAQSPVMISRVRMLAADHFRAAPPSDFNRVIDYVGGQAKAQGRTSLSVGYDVHFQTWIICARSADGASKVGNEGDLLLFARYGITNTDTRAEGLMAGDDYRIVEKKSYDWWRQLLFDLSAYPRMDLAFDTVNYTVLRKPSEKTSASTP